MVFKNTFVVVVYLHSKQTKTEFSIILSHVSEGIFLSQVISFVAQNLCEKVRLVYRV